MGEKVHELGYRRLEEISLYPCASFDLVKNVYFPVTLAGEYQQLKMGMEERLEKKAKSSLEKLVKECTTATEKAGRSIEELHAKIINYNLRLENAAEELESVIEKNKLSLGRVALSFAIPSWLRSNKSGQPYWKEDSGVKSKTQKAYKALLQMRDSANKVGVYWKELEEKSDNLIDALSEIDTHYPTKRFIPTVPPILEQLVGLRLLAENASKDEYFKPRKFMIRLWGVRASSG